MTRGGTRRAARRVVGRVALRAGEALFRLERRLRLAELDRRRPSSPPPAEQSSHVRLIDGRGGYPGGTSDRPVRVPLSRGASVPRDVGAFLVTCVGPVVLVSSLLTIGVLR